MPLDLEDEKQKELFREALAEAIDAWLDKQFSKFGRWSFYGIASALFAWVSYLYLNGHGFKP